MRIVEDIELIYLAIPRSGSTSLRRAIDISSNDYVVITNSDLNLIDHCTYREVINGSSRDRSEYEMLITVRPVSDRILSLFYHRLKKAPNSIEAKWSKLSIKLSWHIFLLRLLFKRGRLLMSVDSYVEGYSGTLHCVNVSGCSNDILSDLFKKEMTIIKSNTFTPEYGKIALPNMYVNLFKIIYRKDIKYQTENYKRLEL